MCIPMAPAAGLRVLKVWEAEAARQEAGGAKERRLDRVAPVETLMIPATGPASTALLPTSGLPPFARFASIVGKPPHFPSLFPHNTQVNSGHVEEMGLSPSLSAKTLSGYRSWRFVSFGEEEEAAAPAGS